MTDRDNTLKLLVSAEAHLGTKNVDHMVRAAALVAALAPPLRGAG
jgi:hypothetical protein